MAQKRKFVKGDYVQIKNYDSGGLWEIYSIRKFGRKTRYSVKKLESSALTLLCNIAGARLKKMEEK
jgi:hypothetical protein